MPVELDYMEYANDGAAQAAYKDITELLIGAEEVPVDEVSTGFIRYTDFICETSGLCNILTVYCLVSSNVRAAIYTADGSYYPTTLLAETNSVALTAGGWRELSLISPVSLTATQHYVLAVQCQTAGGTGAYNTIGVIHAFKAQAYGTFPANAAGYTSQIHLTEGVRGRSRVLRCYSENTIKQQGSYSLKTIALQTGSLNKSVIRSILGTFGADVTSGETYTASSEYGGRGPENAFNDILGAQGWLATANTNQWIKVDFGAGDEKTITKMRINNLSESGFSTRNLKHFKLEGSNNNSDWTKISAIAWVSNCELYNTDEITLDQLTDYTTFAEIRFNNSTAYRYYRLWCYDNWGGANYLGIGEIEMMETIGDGRIDLSDQSRILIDVRASRAGSQFKISIHDSGGTTSEHTVNIADANTWQTDVWDISGVSNTDKDLIDEIKITILNADSENTIYLDNIYATLVGIDITVSLSKQELALIQQVLATKYDFTVFPVAQSLLLAPQAPTLKFDFTVFPAAQSLVLTQRTPTVSIDFTALLAKQSLGLTQQEMTVEVAVTILMAAQSLVLSQKTPDTIFDFTVFPARQSLGLAQQAVFVVIPADITVILDALALELRQYSPAAVVRFTEIPSFMLRDIIDPYSGGAWLWLMEVNIPGFNIYRRARNTELVEYDSNDFLAGNFIPGKQSLTGDGSIPRILLRVAQEPDKTLEKIINASQGGRSGTVKIIRVNENYLDNPVDALEATYGILTANSDSQWVMISMGIPNPLTQRIPLWSYSSKSCPLSTPSLFKGVKCQYTGTDLTCTGLYEDCYLKGNARHWGAEIGLDPNAVRM